MERLDEESLGLIARSLSGESAGQAGSPEPHLFGERIEQQDRIFPAQA